ncbi:MAG: YXWGXW repeat-containing protein [Candidatus Omnitrophica bacterium]|nr:YXWGXW repeat-containing protein [Candidatus Omnitrophota bacterium]MCM8770800.1 YXWGXW repeat-containing protein [Candidatus Omnitrophota bacterium]
MRRVLFLPFLLGVVLFCGCRTVIYQEVPPAPAPKIEIRGTPPHPKAVWIPGHWSWKGPRHGYVWIPGHWKIK